MNPVVVSERRSFLVVLVLLGICFLFLLKPVFLAVLLAAILAILLYPLYTFLLRLFKGRRHLAAFAATFLIFITLILPFTVIAILIVNQIVQIVPGMDIRGLFDTVMSKEFYQENIQPIVLTAETKLGVSIDLADVLSRLGKEVAQAVYNFSPQVLGRTASFIFNFLVMHFSIYFLFVEGRTVAKMLFDLSPLQKEHEFSLTREFKNMLHATVYGYLLTALVQAILASIGFAVAGVQGFLIFGTLTFFMSLVPIVGATSVWLPITVWYFIQGNNGWGVFLLVYGLVVISGIDNIIKPMIMRGKAKIHILLIFFSLFGGIQLFGPIGILLGPVITALFLACIRIYREDFLGLPPSVPDPSNP